MFYLSGIMANVYSSITRVVNFNDHFFNMPELYIGNINLKIPIIQEGYTFASAYACRVKEIISAKALFSELTWEYSEAAQASENDRTNPA